MPPLLTFAPRSLMYKCHHAEPPSARNAQLTKALSESGHSDGETSITAAVFVAACLSSQYARAALFNSSVITTPSSNHSNLMDPASWPVTLRETSVLPNPPGPVGVETGGPPRSV